MTMQPILMRQESSLVLDRSNVATRYHIVMCSKPNHKDASNSKARIEVRIRGPAGASATPGPNAC